MQVRHRHVVIFERPRQKAVHERGLRRRQPTFDADRSCLFRTALRYEPSSKRSRRVEIRCPETAADSIEKMLPGYRDHCGRQPVDAELVNKARNRAAQIPVRLVENASHAVCALTHRSAHSAGPR